MWAYIWLDYKHAMEKLNFKNAKDVLAESTRFPKETRNSKRLNAFILRVRTR